MKRSFLALSLGIGAMLLATHHAFAQAGQNCAPRERVITQLAERFGETRQSIGIESNNSVVEVFASNETGSWTIILTLPNGLSCLVAAGESFETLAENLPDQSQNDA